MARKALLALLLLSLLCAASAVNRPVNRPVVAAKSKKAAPKPIRAKVVCSVVNQNPPYKAVNCMYALPPQVKIPVCAQLACNPLPPGKCPDGPAQASTGNQVCSWNLSINCTSLTPVAPGTRWNFGFMTQDPRPVNIQVLGRGFVASRFGATCGTQ